MNRAKRISELQYLENYRVLFANLDEVQDLKTELADYGYDDAKIAEGKALFDHTQQLYNQNQQETAEEKEAYARFSDAFDVLKKTYSKHRKIAKVALMKKPELWKTLALDGSLSAAYLKAMQEIKTFYEQAQSHSEAQPLLEKFKINKAAVDAQIAQIQQVETLRAAYEKEKGESQDATQQKNKAFATLSDWVREFYAVAQIALDDRPQLLENIGKFVRS
ncbi:hypothetical protein PG316_08455 [Riemerella anatipestifer]|uniref:hypothetical protein n=1 Tax=Riemerella anatipestifer TaxID=34085 RepID=UPI00285C5AE2|nr:hypothetical protein [Riemerella anatipestifer]MDR7732111.1 hypothetical protein [Riemerella anatipestifer]MDR7786599.1 hypothetical protein [Riemerella anatipestifer]MDY3321572.1 hypothetical protein [Riemerella anatipestifer]MDY3337086.1 hypothetical protein [Riemerella anatipestifer]MDY3400094.1 hypothetical protein [Riemerella anatipestifer]